MKDCRFCGEALHVGQVFVEFLRFHIVVDDVGGDLAQVLLPHALQKLNHDVFKECLDAIGDRISHLQLNLFCQDARTLSQCAFLQQKSDEIFVKRFLVTVS